MLPRRRHERIPHALQQHEADQEERREHQEAGALVAAGQVRHPAEKSGPSTEDDLPQSA